MQSLYINEHIFKVFSEYCEEYVLKWRFGMAVEIDKSVDRANVSTLFRSKMSVSLGSISQNIVHRTLDYDRFLL